MTSDYIVTRELDAVAAGNLDLAREALVPELGATSEVCLAPLFDLEALQLREAVVEDVALAVVALVRARLDFWLVSYGPLARYWPRASPASERTITRHQRLSN